MTFIRAHQAEIILFTLSLFVHVACFFAVVHAHGSVLDAVRADDGYFELAQNVLAGNGFSWSDAPPYEPNPLRTPGYVYVLAGLIGIAGVTGAAVIQLIAASCIPLFGMYIARSLTASPRIGFLAGVILALDPTLALLSFQFYTETLFLLLFLPWIMLTLRYLDRRDEVSLILGATLLGCAILVKASVQYILPVLALFILWHFGTRGWRRGVRHVALSLGIVALILAPWIVRNIQTFGEAGLSAQTPFVLYTNLAPAVLSIARGSDFQEEVRAFMTEEEFSGDAITLENGGIYAARAMEVVRTHPAATLFVAAKSLFTFFTNDGFYTLLARSGYAPGNHLPLLIVARLIWIAITAAAFLGGLVYLLKERSQRALLMVLLVGYFALTSTIAAFGTNPRYRLPVDPIIIAFAAIGISYALSHIPRFRTYP